MSAPSAQQLLEGNRADFAANVLAAFGFGMYVVLAIQIFRNHARKPIKRMQRAHRLMLLYSVVMLCLVCVWYAVGTAFSEYVDVEVPFQPDLARALTSCQPMAITRTLSHTLMTWLSDGLLIWRTYIVWDGNMAVVAFPFLVYLASIGLGIALELSCLGKDMGGQISLSQAIHLGLPFYGLSIGLTLITTALIAYKLLSHRRELRRAGINLANALDTYASVSNIMIESGLLYTIFGVIFFPLQILDLPAVTPIGVIFTCTTFISPALIQLRIAEGVAYSEESTKLNSSDRSIALAPSKFNTSNASETQYTSSKGTWVEKEVEISHHV